MPADATDRHATSAVEDAREWNVLVDPWLEVVDADGRTTVVSPIEALDHAAALRRIAADGPLDYFAAHRFLLTLVYWKAAAAGGVRRVREALLDGRTPEALVEALRAESGRFGLFDAAAPFLQDPTVAVEPSARTGEPRKGDVSSAGSLFAEFACGTNIAHFHHGDDWAMRLCLPCATAGMLQVVAWTQSGRAGLTPSIHNAPPIMALAEGPHLAETLGRNLVPLSVPPGTARWSGHFTPSDPDSPIGYMEAFTWNPRRIHLRSPAAGGVCWRCGATDVPTVGPIVYRKNEATKLRKKGNSTIPFLWQDPAAFYATDDPWKAKRSVVERRAAEGRDLYVLCDKDAPPASLVARENAAHRRWWLAVPCTNPANNKTFDHRSVRLSDLRPEAIARGLPASPGERPLKGVDGWSEPARTGRYRGSRRFVLAAAALSHGDWAVLASAAGREMHESPPAFDLFSGLWWPLRRAPGVTPPAREVAWLVLKLMATAPPSHRHQAAGAAFLPISKLPKRQPPGRRDGRKEDSRYPVAFPRGPRLETSLRQIIHENLRDRKPEPVDWAGLCDRLHQLVR